MSTQDQNEIKTEMLKLRNLPSLDEILEQKDFESGTYTDLMIKL